MFVILVRVHYLLKVPQLRQLAYKTDTTFKRVPQTYIGDCKRQRRAAYARRTQKATQQAMGVEGIHEDAQEHNCHCDAFCHERVLRSRLVELILPV